MKAVYWLIITLSVISLIIGVPIAYYATDPKTIEQTKELNDKNKWVEDSFTVAHKTNDTAILKSIYIKALDKGADPDANCFWYCSYLTELYKYSYEKYEALKK